MFLVTEDMQSMDARYLKIALAVGVLSSLGASYRTENFVVTASSPQFAKEVGQLAETQRQELAELWLGKALPKWSQPCPIAVTVGEHLGAGGATSFVFDRGQVFGWRMNIQGSRERILDSVLPHEVTHTILATHFRRPLPRWADEGACTTVEHTSERSKQDRMLIRFLRTDRGIAFSRMFAMKEYPPEVMPLYSQGYSLARFLIAQGGHQHYLSFLADGMAEEKWSEAIRKNYSFENLADLQDKWLAWVAEGSPKLSPPSDGTVLASQETTQDTTPTQLASASRRKRPEPNLVYHETNARSPQEEESSPMYDLRPGVPAGQGGQMAVDPNQWRPSGPQSSLPMSSAVGDRRDNGAGAGLGRNPQSKQVLLQWSRSGEASGVAPRSSTAGPTPSTAGRPTDGSSGVLYDSRVLPSHGQGVLRR
jgi:hypothetical protein